MADPVLGEDFEQLEIPGLEDWTAVSEADKARQRLRIDEGRARLMEAIYQSSDRTDPSHPLHARYTGLFDEACLKVGRRVLELATME